MGANSQEYNKSLAERLEEDHEKSYLGKKYDTLAKKTGPLGIMGSMAAPMIGGSIGNLAAGVTNNDDWANYATMGGSAVGAAMAPIMYRSMQKQATKDIKDTNSRNINLKNGGKVSGVQSLDSMLNAGKSSKSAFMGAMAGGYGYGALTGNMMDPTTMMIAGKTSNALSNPGAMAYLAASQMSGANYLGNIFGDEKPHQAALLGSSIKGLGNAYNGFFGEKLAGPVSDGADALGNSSAIGDTLKDFGSGVHDLTGMSGSLTGMLTYMLASAGGNKLIKSIKSSAQAKDTKKYNYKVGDLGRPASTDRDVTKYDTMKPVSAQVNLLTVTGQLSPFESLALGYYQSMDKHLLFLNTIYDILNENEQSDYNKKEDTFEIHNKIGDLFNELAYDENGFSTKNNYLKKTNKGYAERTGDRISDIYTDSMEFLQKVSTDTNAMFEAWNPLKILTGGMLGNSSTKNIKALYGLDEESKKEDALNQTASNINVPTSMVQVAEMDISQVMKMSDTIEGKQLAIQSFSASLLQNLLRLRLDEKSQSETGSSFFNQTQTNMDALGHDSWYDKLKNSAIMGLGNLPILNIIAAEIMGSKGRAKRKEDLESTKGPNTVDGLALSESNDLQNDDFLSFQFPSLFLENISLDEERNQLLKQMLECWDCDLSKIKKKSFGVYDTINGQVTDEVGVQNSFKNKFDEDSSSIYKQYKLAIENDPKNENEYIIQQNEEILGLEKKLTNDYEQSNLGFSNGVSNGVRNKSVGDSQEEEKDKKYKSKMLEAFEAIAENNKKESKTNLKDNTVDKSTNLIKTGWNKFGLLGALFGTALIPVIGTGKLIGFALKSLLTFAISHKKMGTGLAVAAGLGYLAYENKDFIVNSAKKISKSVSKIGDYFQGDGLNDGWDNWSNVKKTGVVSTALGGLLITVPNPYAKAAGAIMLLAGTGLQLNWKKTISDVAKNHPDFVNFISKFIPDKDLVELGIINKNSLSKLENNNYLTEDAKRRNKAYKEELAEIKKLKSTTLIQVSKLKKELVYIKDDRLRNQAQKILDKLNKDDNDYIDKNDRIGREKEFDKLQNNLMQFINKSDSSNKMITKAMLESHEITNKEYTNFLRDISKHNYELRSLLAEQIAASKYQITAQNPKYDKLIR